MPCPASVQRVEGFPLSKFRATRYLIFILAVVAVSACSQPPGDGIKFGLASAPINLDPRFATDAASSRINRLIYQSLVDFDESYRPQPALANWDVISPTHYRFTLAKDSVFHSAGKLTSGDVKNTYDSILDPATKSPHRAAFNMIEAIDVSDDRTIDFRLSKPDLLFPGRLTIGILPSELIASGHPFNSQPVGSGSFEFISWPEEGLLHLQRISDGQRISFLKVKDPTVRVLKLQRGEIDMLQNDLPKELVSHITKQDDLTLKTGPGSNFTYLGFNLQDEDTGRDKLRKAIAYALNREEIIKYVMGGAAQPASALLPPDHWASRKLPLYPYDPQRARVLLKEAGYTGGKRPLLVYKTSSDPFRIRLATVIQQQLSEVGIDVDLRSYDWGTFYGDIKAGRFQMFSLSWVGIKTPDIFRYVFHSESIPPKGANRGRFFDQHTDQLIASAEGQPSLEGQADQYQQLQAHLLEQLPYVPLWYEDHFFAARSNIEGYTLARDGNYDGLIYVKRR